ncbi:DUF397 domain-containing protein [Streptomyces flavidovirens]|uniref:DUF397 domain-containing protein n=1 Tax=Streptomyces flavidovirens TaxID=67298 RepID=UPI00048B62EB|nr:DUF397 domain-containing protein [Streptomyces flavidovirens]
MSTPHWQKSSYSGDSSNCLEIRADRQGVKLRESDDPAVVLTATTQSVRQLVLGLKTHGFSPRSADA